MNLDTLRHDVPTSLILAAALLLFVSPVLLMVTGAAAISAYLLGLVGVAVAGKALLRPDRQDRWLMVVVGALTAAAPWIAGFAAGSIVTVLHLAIGAVFLARALVPALQPGRRAPHTAKLEDDAMPTH